MNYLFKQKQKQKHKRKSACTQPTVQIVDKLQEQLLSYKQSINYKNEYQNERASTNLRKYITQQENNLKFMRMKKSIDPHVLGVSLNKSRVAELKFEFQQRYLDENKASDIPMIDDFFKNQVKEYVLQESRQMKKSLEKAIESIDTTVKGLTEREVEKFAFGTRRTNFSGRSNHKRYDALRFGLRKDSQVYTRNRGYSITNCLPEISPVIVNEEDELQLDDRIEKKLKKSQKLLRILEHQKMKMKNKELREKKLNERSKQTQVKERYCLEGVRSVSYNRDNQHLQVTPGCRLLFELNMLNQQRVKKQTQLKSLLNNSYKNREDILYEKSQLYDQSTKLSSLSPSHQFQLRNQIDRRLSHRIELSCEQVNKFINFLYQIRSYHTIFDQTLLSILKQIRQALKGGRFIKICDLDGMLQNKNKSALNKYPNCQIIKKLYEIMI